MTAVFVPVQWLAVRFDWPLRDRLPAQYARWLCTVMGIRVETFGRPCREPGVLLAVNHMSYLDMPVLAGIIPVSFVARLKLASGRSSA